MKLEHVKVGEYVFIDKPGSQHHREEGKVLSIFSDYGLDSDLVAIRLLLEDGTVVPGLKAEEISP